MTYNPTWPAEQRLKAVAAIVAQIQLDIPAGVYSRPGRPNCQSALHIAHDSADTLHDAMSGAPAWLRAAVGLSRPGKGR